MTDRPDRAAEPRPSDLDIVLRDWREFVATIRAAATTVDDVAESLRRFRALPLWRECAEQLRETFRR